ncbi:MAG: hypothetical protein ACOC3T_04235, partial [Bacteroidota bacterium]
MKNMKIYLLLFVMLAKQYGLFSQGVKIDQALDCYRYIYKVQDRQSSYVWDRHHTNNVYSNTTYHGGSNQKWMVMPTYPGSREAMFINLDGGKILDSSKSPSSLNNIYCFGGKHHGGQNQLFYMSETSGDFFTIESVDIPLVIDKKSSNDLYCNTEHGGYNQQFKFTPVGTIPNYNKLVLVQNFAEDDSHSNIANPPQPMSYEDAGLNIKHNYTLISKAFIPFAYVNDPGRDYAWQAANSPYYILERYQYWKLEQPYSIGYGLHYATKVTESSGLTTTEQNSIETTFGVKLTRKNEIGITGTLPDYGILVNLSKIFEANMGLTIKQNVTVEETYMLTKDVEFEKVVNEALLFHHYRLVEEYKMYRLNSNHPYKEWDFITEDVGHLYTHPYTKMELIEGNKSTNDIYLMQMSVPENSIPRMFSNNSPTGQSEASSSFSSTTYSPWKAFDGEDESGAWSRWISKPTGSFTEEWISYEFDESITLMAYNITPETGGSISRT